MDRSALAKPRVTIAVPPHNDSGCGWINTLPKRQTGRRLTSDQTVDYAVIGAGFTGLAVARRLAELFPGKRIALIEGQRAGEGASARNSGFIVEASPGRVGSDQAMTATAGRAYRLNRAGIAILRKQVQDNAIDCQWDERGKFHCAADLKNKGALETFAKLLDSLSVPYQWMDDAFLRDRLGTGFYKIGIWTKEGVLVQPAALVRGLIETLPPAVELFEESPVEAIDYGAPCKVRCPGGVVTAQTLVLATNAYLSRFGVYGRRLMPLTMTASLTRPLSAAERARIADPSGWGILSAHRMGATVRYTEDHRVMIRNTAEYRAEQPLDAAAMASRRAFHTRSLRRRFPELEDLGFEHTWQGLVCISANYSSVFGRLADRVYAAGCYNAGGIARGSAFGQLLADYIAGNQSALIADALSFDAPAALPPRPFLDLGAALKVWRMSLGVGQEV